MVDLPLWKYESQLGWFFPVYGKYKQFQTSNQMSKINLVNIIQLKYPELVVSIYPKKYESLWKSIGICLELRDIKLCIPTNTDGNKL